MPNLSNMTRDHDEIRRWAEERGGTPSHVVGTGSGDDIGILRFDFPGYSGEGSLEPISWEQFFEKFDERGLVLLYQEETAGGARSNFNKLISGETAEEADEAGRKRETASGTGRHSHRSAQGKKPASKSTSGLKKSAGAARSSPAKKTSATKKASDSRGAAGSAKKSATASSKKSAGARKNPPLKKRANTSTSRKSASVKKSAMASKRGAPAKKAGRKTGPATSTGKRAAAKKATAKRRR
ncbi:MAG: hypothetical protein JO270_04500 [Acidobacteriaceae bacterium]|nr:hypothetical protein [Acidobacteriaceae bacterium]